MGAYLASGGVAVGILDAITNAAVGISYEHHEVHEGDSFLASAVDETMSNGDTLALAFRTPDTTKRAHMFAQFSTLVGGKLEIMEGATWTAQTGTSAPIINRKRLASPKSSILLADRAQATFVAGDEVGANMTLGTTGTILPPVYAWGEKGKIGAGTTRANDELLLKPDTQYYVRFTAIGNSNKAQLILSWYEHTDSN